MLPDGWVIGVASAVAIGAGVIGGVFYAFSTFVMGALARRPATEGLAAMQAINVTVLNPLFLVPFLGTAVASAAGIVFGVLRWSDPGGIPLAVAGAFYLVGTFGVTMALNVPLNNALEKQNPADAAAATFWTFYVKRWTFWNHVRTVAALVAMVFAIVSLTR